MTAEHEQTGFPHPEDMEARLWEYIDGFSDATEKAAVEKLIAENGEWKARYSELLLLHQLTGMTGLEEPSLRFTQNIMEEIARHQIAPATKTYINKRIIWGIAAFFITIIAGFLVYAISQVNWSETKSDGTIGGVDLTRINYGAVFNNTFVNIFMMLNVLLGLMFLDRYLAARRREMREQP
jgi:magnesium-transporting ATPase (P-type)